MFMSKREWIDIGVCSALLCGVYVGRAWLVAAACGGRYPWADMLTDASVLALLIVALRVLDFGLNRGIVHWLGQQSAARRLVGGSIRVSVVLAIAAPLLISILQFCPQRQTCTTTPAAVGLT